MFMLQVSKLTKPMHFFKILHTLKSLLVNIGAGSDVLQEATRDVYLLFQHEIHL